MLFLLSGQFKPLTLQLAVLPNLQRRAERRENSLMIMFFGARKDLAGVGFMGLKEKWFDVRQTLIRRTFAPFATFAL